MKKKDYELFICLLDIHLEELIEDNQVCPVSDDREDYKIQNISELIEQLESLKEEASYMMRGSLREKVFYRDFNALKIILKMLKGVK